MLFLNTSVCISTMVQYSSTIFNVKFIDDERHSSKVHSVMTLTDAFASARQISCQNVEHQHTPQVSSRALILMYVFNKCMRLCNHHPTCDIEHVHLLRKFSLASLQLTSPYPACTPGLHWSLFHSYRLVLAITVFHVNQVT